MWSEILDTSADQVLIETFGIERGDGVVRQFRLSGRVVFNEDGSPSFRGVSHDVTGILATRSRELDNAGMNVARALAALTTGSVVVIDGGLPAGYQLDFSATGRAGTT